jgi:hypothetical protein
MISIPDRIGTALRIDYPDPRTLASYRFRDDAEMLMATVTVEDLHLAHSPIPEYKVSVFIHVQGERHQIDSWTGSEHTLQLRLVEMVAQVLAQHLTRLTQALRDLPAPATLDTNPTLWDRLDGVASEEP